MSTITLYPGQVADIPIYLQYGAAKSININVVGQNLAGNTIVFKAWAYPGASLTVDDNATVANNGANTDIGVALTGSQTELSYARGWYSLHDETRDVIMMKGPLIVETYPT